MATMKKEHEAPAQVPGPPTTDQTSVVQHTDIKDLFRREVTGNPPTRQFTLKRVLTRPLVSMAHQKQLSVTCLSEMYLMELPLTGRAGGTGQTRVIDCRDNISGDEIILVCNEMIVSAFQRAGYTVIKRVTDAKGNETFPPIPGASIKDKAFAILGGDIADGKRYRSIAVAELE